GGVEAAHEHRIAGGGVAVLAGIEGADAGRIAQRLGQGGGGLLAEQVLADHLDGAGGGHQRLVELGRGQFAGVRPGLLAAHLDLFQGAGGQGVGGGSGAGVGPGREGGGAGQGQPGGQGGGEGRGGRVGRRGVLAGGDKGHGRSVRRAKRETAPDGAAPLHSITDKNRSQYASDYQSLLSRV